LSVGDLLRAEVEAKGKSAEVIAANLAEGKMVDKAITVELLKKAIAEAKSSTVLVDGFPRALDQVESFKSGLKADCDFVLFFDCNEELLTQRLLKRGETSGRSDDNSEAIKKRFETFHRESVPVVTLYEEKGMVRRVDSSVGTADEVFERVKALFEANSRL
jgi:adenylate kinase family enzyme